MQQPTQSDPSDPNAQPSPNVSMQLNQRDAPKHVRAEGDLKPIAVSQGQDWAMARAVGKATPVSRTIQIVALKNKWLIRYDDGKEGFDRIILQDSGPQQSSEELATAIRGRVDSWGASLPGGYWVPLIVVEAASDADLSVARLHRLLEGSGTDLKVVPLTIPRK
jgi:hypothetical protein